MTYRLRIKKLTPEAIIPSYAHDGDAGLDLFAADQATIAPGERRLIGTGISIELPADTEGSVRPRSGLALHHGVTVLNAPGTIDRGYRGELGVILINHGSAPFSVTPGMKIAQLVVAPCSRVEVEHSTELTPSSRGAGGFGSTGV